MPRRKTPHLPDLPPQHLVARDILLGTVVALLAGIAVIIIAVAVIVSIKY